MFSSDIFEYWRIRKRNIIISNILGVLLTAGLIYLGYKYIGFEDLFETTISIVLFAIVLWILLSWIIGTILTIAFSGKCDDRLSSIGRSILQIFFGTIASTLTSGGVLFVFFLIWALIKLAVGLAVLAVIFAINFVAYPFTTLIAFIRTRKPKN